MTPGVRLRKVEGSDLPSFFDYQRDPPSIRMAAVAARDRVAFDAHWRKILADEANVIRTILSGGDVAGYVLSWQPAERRFVGYWLGRDHWGRGIATEALVAFLTEVRSRPLFAHVAKHNVGSIRVLQKCGFSVVGEGTVPRAPGDGPVEEYIFRLDGERAEPGPDRAERGERR